MLCFAVFHFGQDIAIVLVIGDPTPPESVLFLLDRPKTYVTL
ncbi:hypothetical protein BTN49_1789 [Candidatus Enterovibrio escicola]|uniref:Uncharacterized protein n=2 Tax=Candidatus Enterovibrio escicola TaxID=1927127 RepID=A0A2A5T377_9GAMM|nr:hypothetical protein BTN49_1789 [Candidatus Enterovibrio escacola]